MGTISKPYDFSANTTISSSQVDSNFDTIYNEFNGSIAAANLATDSVTTAKIADSNVTTAKLADGSITNAKVATGVAVQVGSTVSTAVATTTTLIPVDDTIPQITEGAEFMTLSYTPKAATNLLVIQVVMMGSSSVANGIIVALFQDATANALAAAYTYQATSTGNVAVPLTHTMTAGTTSAITFRVRGGSQNAGTFTFNGFSGGRIFGGITKSSIVITEYKV